MKKFIATLFLLSSLFIFANPILAQGLQGKGVNVQKAGDVVGNIEPPQTVIRTVDQTGTFISVIVRFIIVVAGLYALWQFLTGGLGYITSGGDKGKIQLATQQIMMSITGLAIIGASFILASIIGRLLFGAGFNLLSPVLQSV